MKTVELTDKQLAAATAMADAMFDAAAAACPEHLTLRVAAQAYLAAIVGLVRNADRIYPGFSTSLVSTPSGHHLS